MASKRPATRKSKALQQQTPNKVKQKQSKAKPTGYTQQATKGRTSVKQTACSSKKDASNKTGENRKVAKQPPLPIKEQMAVITLQRAARAFLARRKFARLQMEKKTYDELMEKLENEAWLEMINKEREARDLEERKQAQVRKQRKEKQRREKKMLEAAFDGEVEEIMSILKEVESTQLELLTDVDEVVKNIKLNRAKMEIIDCCDANKNTPLSEGSAGRQLEVVQLLIGNGANVNSFGAFERTPLYRAAFAGSLDVVKLLLMNGADPRLPDSSGSKPVDIAATSEIEDFLTEWKIETTERILEDRTLELKKLKDEETERQRGDINKLEDDLHQAELHCNVCQLQLKKCYQELQKRTREHDKCFQSSKADLTLQALNDSERDLKEAIANESKSRDKLQRLRKKMRDITASTEEEGEEEGSLIKCHIKELNDIIIRDVDGKIKESAK